MLIVKTFHDYYDGVSQLGVDKTCVYNRVSSRNEFPKEHFLTWKDQKYLPHDTLFNGAYYRSFIIGFCGNYYLGYEFERKGDREKVLYCEYSYDKIHKLLTEYQNNHFYYEDYFENAVLFYKTLKDLSIFRKYHCPCFVLDNGTTICKESRVSKPALVVNPCLKNYNFQVVKDAYTAHQEIYQFLSGVLGNHDNPIVEVGEKDKLIQHGMDKWSFRNPDPPKRKQK